MKLNVHVEARRLMQTMREVRPTLRKSGKEMVRAGAKLATRKAIEMTPPFVRKGDGLSLDKDGKDRAFANAKEAKKRGENAILTDAFGSRAGSSRGKTKRSGIFFVADETMLRKFRKENPGGETERLFLRKDGTVWATEKRYYHPGASVADMNAHHAQYWNNGRMSSAGTKTRDIGRWKFIDRMVVGPGAQKRWLKARYQRVGFLAAGWLNAANELKVARVPAWIKRHTTAPGTLRFSESGGRFMIYVINSVKFGRNAQLDRIVPYALRAASLGMKAQAKHIALKAMKRAGFTLSSAALV